MYPSEIKTKIDCCFADDMYQIYQLNRYGISPCNTIDTQRTYELNNLRKVYNFYNSLVFSGDCDINPAYNQPVFGGCNVNKLVEKISLL